MTQLFSFCRQTLRHAARATGIAQAAALPLAVAHAKPISQVRGEDWRKSCTRANGTVSTVCCTNKANDCLADCGSGTSAAVTQCKNQCNASWNTCKAAARTGADTGVLGGQTGTLSPDGGNGGGVKQPGAVRGTLPKLKSN